MLLNMQYSTFHKQIQMAGKKSLTRQIYATKLQGEYINAKYSVKQGNFYTKGEGVTKSSVQTPHNASILGE